MSLCQCLPPDYKFQGYTEGLRKFYEWLLLAAAYSIWLKAKVVEDKLDIRNKIQPFIARDIGNKSLIDKIFKMWNLDQEAEIENNS